MKLVLRAPFASLWQGQDAFAGARMLSGQVYRELEGRRTLRTEIEGRGYFVKCHTGIGWGEIFKNLLSLKGPVWGASHEWRACERLREAGIPALHAVAFGARGWNPARRESFLITEELAPTVSLEDYTLSWIKTPPAPGVKRSLIARVASMVGGMHRAGVNHRDCYICHFLLHLDRPDLQLSLIDLHRAQTRAQTPRRWRDKDLAALYFSVLDLPLTQRDRLRFLRDYFQRPLRQVLQEERALLQWLEAKAVKLYDRKQRYGDAL